MTFTGPFDEQPFPDKLQGHVVAPDADPRIHGYATQSDLARSVPFLDIGWLALTGNLPTDGERRPLGIALAWLAPLHVGEGPTHAIVLARIAGGPDHVLPGVAGLALGQLAAHEIETAGHVGRWLDGSGELPAASIATAPAAVAAYQDLARDSAAWFAVPLPPSPALTRVAAAYALLHRLGITDSLRLQAFSAWARLPAVMAEAAYARPGAVRAYPARLPDYQYTEEP